MLAQEQKEYRHEFVSPNHQIDSRINVKQTNLHYTIDHALTTHTRSGNNYSNYMQQPKAGTLSSGSLINP